MGLGKLVRYFEDSLYRGSFPYITLLLGWRIWIVIPRTSLYRGSLNRGSSVQGSWKHTCMECSTFFMNFNYFAQILGWRTCLPVRTPQVPCDWWSWQNGGTRTFSGTLFNPGSYSQNKVSMAILFISCIHILENFDEEVSRVITQENLKEANASKLHCRSHNHK